MQIRLNASSLEEWARQNRLPSKMVSVHFAPLNQLLQWLQCLSSEQAIDGLIGTIHSLRSLNPLQLRRAVRDYRYEVDEQHIDEDCSQYLAQIQSQWERMRLQRTVEGLVPGATRQPLSELEQKLASPSAEDAAEAQAKVTRMIDEVFVDTSTFGNYSPPTAAPAMGELLNSRYMVSGKASRAADFLTLLTRVYSPSSHSPSRLLHPCSSTTAQEKRSVRLLPPTHLQSWRPHSVTRTRPYHSHPPPVQAATMSMLVRNQIAANQIRAAHRMTPMHRTRIR